MRQVQQLEQTARADHAFGSTGAAPAVQEDNDASPAAPAPWWDMEPSPAELTNMFKAALAMPVVDRSLPDKTENVHRHIDNLLILLRFIGGCMTRLSKEHI